MDLREMNRLHSKLDALQSAYALHPHSGRGHVIRAVPNAAGLSACPARSSRGAHYFRVAAIADDRHDDDIAGPKYRAAPQLPMTAR